jgi:hypothetical protein
MKIKVLLYSVNLDIIAKKCDLFVMAIIKTRIMKFFNISLINFLFDTVYIKTPFALIALNEESC